MRCALARKLLRVAVLCGAALALAGCVYLRLLELKRQFAHFDEHFAVEPSNDLVMRCLHPILSGSDLRWIGAEPHAVTPAPQGEAWTIRWLKVPPSGSHEPSLYDMEIGAVLSDDRLTEIKIPERYFAYFPKELFINLLRSTGSAKVNREDKQAEAQTETPEAIPLPKLDTVESMLGAPTQRAVAQGQTTYFYSYRLDIPDTKTPPVELTFVFDTASGDLRKLVVRLKRGTLKYDFGGKQEKR